MSLCFWFALRKNNMSLDYIFNSGENDSNVIHPQRSYYYRETQFPADLKCAISCWEGGGLVMFTGQSSRQRVGLVWLKPGPKRLSHVKSLCMPFFFIFCVLNLVENFQAWPKLLWAELDPPSSPNRANCTPRNFWQFSCTKIMCIKKVYYNIVSMP